MKGENFYAGAVLWTGKKKNRSSVAKGSTLFCVKLRREVARCQICLWHTCCAQKKQRPTHISHQAVIPTEFKGAICKTFTLKHSRI